MRKLSVGEQNLVGKLIANSADPATNFPIKILESVFQDNKVTFHGEEEPYFNFFVAEGKEDSVKELTKRIYSKVLEAINLVDYLKSQHMLFEMTSIRDKKVFGDDVGYVSAGLVEVRVFIEEELIATKLKNFLSHAVYVADALRDLQNDEFKTFEENAIAEIKSVGKKARNAVLVALLAVLVAAAGVVLTAQGAGNSDDGALKQATEAIQGTLENKMIPAIAEVKTEVVNVKEAVNNLDAEPVNLSDLQKDSDEAPKAESKKKSKKRKRK